jgi:hypothetical protein
MECVSGFDKQVFAGVKRQQRIRFSCPIAMSLWMAEIIEEEGGL